MAGERSRRPRRSSLSASPGKRSTPTSRVVNSPWRLSRGKPRLCAIASRSAAVQLALIVPCSRPPCRLLRAPFAHVGIDELRPQTDEVGRGARAGVKVELERRSFAVRRGLGLERQVDRRSAGGEAVDDEPRRRLEKAGVGDDGLELDRIGAGSLRAELRVARLEMRGPDPVPRPQAARPTLAPRHASARREPRACRCETAARPHPRRRRRSPRR